MKNHYRSSQLLFVLAILLGGTAKADSQPDSYQAFSLREAVTAWRQGSHFEERANFAGISRFIGAVHIDGDIILIGRVIPGQPKASLDDLAVALRASLHGDTPSVSIDPTEKTPSTGLQAVSFGGGIEGTQFGLDFLNSDIFLKKYSLGQTSSLPAVPQYRVLIEEDTTAELKKSGIDVSGIEWVEAKELADKAPELNERSIAKESGWQEKFWFTPKQRPRMAKQQGVLCIEELQLSVQREILGNNPSQSPSPGEHFAAALTSGSHTLAAQQTAVARIKVLYDLYAIALDITKSGTPSYVADLAARYPIKYVETRNTYPLTVLFGFPQRSDGITQVIRLSGGLSFPSDIQWLNDGDITPLRDIALKSRPTPNSLAWPLPLTGWQMPNAQDLDLPQAQDMAAAPGFVLTAQSFTLDSTTKSSDNAYQPSAKGQRAFDPFGGYPLPSKSLPHSLPTFDYQDRLGGVSLHMPQDGNASATDHSGSLAVRRQQILRLRPQ